MLDKSVAMVENSTIETVVISSYGCHGYICTAGA